MAPKEKCDIFISYKRKNSKVVFKLVEKIEKELGVKCWIDYTGIETTAQFRSIICKAIDASKIVLFMHSKAHLDIDYEEDYTIKELNYAQSKDKPVCLIKLDEAPLDNIFLFEYGSKNYIDYKDKQQVKKLFADLRQFLDIESKPIPNPPMPNPKPGPNPPIPNPIVKRWIYSIACLTICVVIAGVLGYFREHTEESLHSTPVRIDGITEPQTKKSTIIDSSIKNTTAQNLISEQDSIFIVQKAVDKGSPCIVDSQGLKYNLSTKKTAKILGAKNKDNLNAIVIPSKIQYENVIYTVTSIANKAFEGSSVKKVSMFNGVRIIGEAAFCWCSNLVSVTMPNSVTTIRNYAFSGCKLSSLIIPNSVVIIGDDAFSGCNILEVIIPNSVKNIGTAAFSCSTLESLVVEPNNPNYYSSANCIITKKTKELISGCKNSHIPDGVLTISYGTFDTCTELSSIIIPASVKRIDMMAFDWCANLTHVDIANQNIDIDNSAFRRCEKLTHLRINGQLKSAAPYKN